jgi:hypothetical protein
MKFGFRERKHGVAAGLGLIAQYSNRLDSKSYNWSTAFFTLVHESVGVHSRWVGSVFCYTRTK